MATRTYTTIAQIQAAIQQKETSCVELVKGYLEAIKAQQELNIFLEVYEEEALEKAAQVDEKMQKGEGGKLAGLVMGIKDNICFKGHRVGAASKILEGFESLYNATAVERLLDEDVIFIGRLNCDEFAMGGSNENSAYGPALNPVDPAYVTGGSSGGSAAAVKAGCCHATLGSDTGGSIRQPASFCGVFGLKPTYGRVSRYGLLAYASSFDQIGPITHSVEDAAVILEVIAGQDGQDSTAYTGEVPAYSQLVSAPGEKKKIAYIKECIESEGLDPEIKAKTEAVLKQLVADGHEVEAVEFPLLDYVVPAYYILTTAEASSNLSRYDGVHYGHRSSEAVDVQTTYAKSRTEGFGKEVQRRIMLGAFVLSAGYYDAYYAKAQKVRRLIKDWTEETLKNNDFILMPTAPTTAFKLGEKISDPVTMYLQDIFTVQANLAAVPAVSLPLGEHSNGMPFGIQLMGKKYEEADLLAFSKQVWN